VGDFLERLQTLVQARAGANADLARHCGVSTSTASKWLARKMIPTQANLDKLIEWWGRHHSADAPKAGQSVPAAIAPRPQELSLGRLPQDIAARLRRTARQRNLKPLAYLVQILDRQLPTAAELDLR
jgi:transcriptional regulator with XRE-family HTH domain